MPSAPSPQPSQDTVPGVVLQRLLEGGPGHLRESLAELESLEARQQAARPALLALESGNAPGLLDDPRVNCWNWGAFLGGWAWALAHRSYGLGLVLLAFFWLFPLPNLVLGRFGGQLAWRSRTFSGVEEFQAVQRAWALAGAGVALVQVVLVTAALGFLVARLLG